jgi:hypothetical protein
VSIAWGVDTAEGTSDVSDEMDDYERVVGIFDRHV